MNKKGISLAFGLGEFIGILVALGFVVLIFRFIGGDIVKFKVEKEIYEQAGKSVNLLHAIAESSDLVQKDSRGQPEKAVIDIEKLRSNNLNKELECCHYIDYDYYLKVKNLETSETFNLGFPSEKLTKFFFMGKKCGDIYENDVMRTYRIPIIISDQTNDVRHLGEMSIYLVKTPLSNIANSLATACLKSNYVTRVNFYGLSESEDKITIEVDNNIYNICIKTEDGTKMCKMISCGLNIQQQPISNLGEIPEECKGGNDKCKTGCIKRTRDNVVIYVP